MFDLPPAPQWRLPDPLSKDQQAPFSSACSTPSSGEHRENLQRRCHIKHHLCDSILRSHVRVHLIIPLFAQLVFLLFGQVPHRHAEQIVIIRTRRVLFLLIVHPGILLHILINTQQKFTCAHGWMLGVWWDLMAMFRLVSRDHNIIKKLAWWSAGLEIATISVTPKWHYTLYEAACAWRKEHRKDPVGKLCDDYAHPKGPNPHGLR